MRFGINSKPGLVVIWAITFLAGSCIKSKEQPVSSRIPFTPPSVSSPLRMLSLGDSYTIGQSVPLTDRFPHQTVARLKDQNRLFSEPDYIAQTGWTTANLLSAIETANKPKNFDIVTLLIGVNNQYQGRDTAEYRIQFNQCLQQAILHAGNRRERVFVLSIPDYGATPYGQSRNPDEIGREIDGFNRINQSVSSSAGVNYIEITKASRDAITDPSLVAADGLHPSGKEYRKWAEKLASQVLTVLR